MIHHLFMVDLKHPLRKIREIDAEIKVCKKMTWAVDGGKRRMLGGSAFYTRKQAECRKIGLVARIEKDTFLRNQYGAMWDVAHKQMIDYRTKGTVH